MFSFGEERTIKPNTLIIEVEEESCTYLIRVSKVLMPEFQKAIIEGTSKNNIVVFFRLKECMSKNGRI